MKSGTKTNKNQDTVRLAIGTNEALLRSEICFWNDMIASCDPAHPVESLERMQQALALAESRLDTLFRDYQHAYVSDDSKTLPSNVYSISRSGTAHARKSK